MIKKLMKGIFAVFIFSAFTLFVKAEGCIEPDHDNSTSLDRTLWCNADSQKTTRFSYPTSGQVDVFSNSLCTIKCNEDLLLLMDSAKNVRAGMGFNFPLYASGQRVCTATYNYIAFNTNLERLVSERDAATGDAKEQKRREIRTQLDIKNACDKWTTTTKYAVNSIANVSLSLETSEGKTIIPYEFVPSSEYQSTVDEDTTSYPSCDLKDDAGAACTTVSDTVTSWTENARVDGRYTMKNRYIEKYTGKVVEVASPKTCDAKDIYFTSFFEVTRPSSNNPTDKGYELVLTARNLGNNIKATGDKWNLTVNCWYALKNLIFPPKRIPGRTDEYYDKFGGTAFMYRPISLSTPFPNRAPGENWQGKEALITNTKSNIREKALYEIVLNSETIRKLKEYNDHYKYDTFDLTDMERSKFIEANPDIIKRK